MTTTHDSNDVLVDVDEDHDVADTVSVTNWSRFGDGPLPQLAKMAAVNRFYKAALEAELPEGFASALAHGVVDPAAARIAVNSPTKLNVPGGTIEVADLDLWTPGVAPMPTNVRTMDSRVYPAAGVAGYQGPLSGPSSEPGIVSTLSVRAQSVEHVVEQAARSAKYVIAKNSLWQSIGSRGIVMQTDVVYVELEHADGQPTIPLLATAEGSSRATNAHHVLGLDDPQTLHYDFPDDRDMFRRFINDIVAPDPTDPALRTRERERLTQRRNALIMPARVFLRFIPSSGHTYARALNGYLGMLHVDPPKAWSPTGKAEAMAESVLITLGEDGVITSLERDYLGGLMPPAEAKAAGFPTEPDEQAAYVLAALLPESRRELVARGVMDVTAKKSVTAGRRTDVVAELALRPTRSAAVTRAMDSPERGRAERMRAAYMRAARLTWFAQRPWAVTGRPPQEILEAALAEADSRTAHVPENWRSRLELAALSMYHLTQWQVLKREAMGNTGADNRSPYDILKLMLDDRQGLQLLGRALLDGRAGTRPRIVDLAGDIVHGVIDGNDNLVQTAEDNAAEATDGWLRYALYPHEVGRRRKLIKPVRETPHAKLTQLQIEVRDHIEDLLSSVGQINEVTSADGRPLILVEGWAADELITSLMETLGQLQVWKHTAGGNNNASYSNSEDLAIDEEPDDVDDLEVESDENEDQ